MVYDNKECILGDTIYKIIDSTLELSPKAKSDLKCIVKDALTRIPRVEKDVTDSFAVIRKSWLDKNNIKLTDIIKSIKILNEKYNDIIKLPLFLRFPEREDAMELVHEDYLDLMKNNIHSISAEPDGCDMHKIDDILTIFITFSEGFI